MVEHEQAVELVLTNQRFKNHVEFLKPVLETERDHYEKMRCEDENYGTRTEEM